MNILSLLTPTIENYSAGIQPANVANYIEFVDFTKDEAGQITGAKVKDTLKGNEFEIKAKVIVNCAGLRADEIRQLNNPEVQKRLLSSRGTHITLRKNILKSGEGILLPETSDG